MAMINAIEAKILSATLNCQECIEIKAEDWQDDSYIHICATRLLGGVNSVLVALSIRTNGHFYVDDDGTLFLLPINLEGLQLLGLKSLRIQQHSNDLCASCEKYGKTCEAAALGYEMRARAKLDYMVTRCPDFVGKND
jgi:hypothetical protein